MAKGAVEESEAAAATSLTKSAAAASPAKPPAVQSVVEELPKSIVRRVVKDKLAELASSSSRKLNNKNSKEKDGEGEEMSVHKDALLAFAESARIFIHYLSATANDICKESKRQIISADDVLKAIEEIEFPEFIVPLKASLDDFRSKNASKRSGAKAKAKESQKKRKLEDEEPAENGEDAEGAEEDAGGGAGEEEDEEEEGEDPDENE